MTEGVSGVAIYAFFVRMIVEGIQVMTGVTGKRSPRLVQVFATAVSAVFVYLMGVDPMAMLSLGSSVVGAKVAGVALLTGGAVSANDLLDMVPRIGRGGR